MKAIEFVKKFGLEHTKYLIEDTELTEFAIHSTCGGKYYQDTVSVSDLKQIVDAFDQIDSLGGLDEAKEEYHSRIQNNECISGLNKAINLVEQCQ